MPPPHGCGHLESIVTDSRDLTQIPIVNAVETVARITPLFAHLLPASEMDSRHGPPTPIRSLSPLRL